MTDEREHGRWEKAFGVLVLVLGWMAVKGWRKALTERGNDLTIYLDAAAAAWAGENPLGVEGAIYLPFFHVASAPLALLPRALAAGLWQAASLTAAVWCIRTAARLVDPDRRHAGLPFLAGLMTFRLWESNLAYGQANAFVLACLMAALVAMTRGRDARAGAWIGLAAALKILPALALALSAARRSIGGVALGLATLVGCSLFVPPLLLGVEGSREAHLTFWHDVSGPYLEGGQTLVDSRPVVSGQSLTAALYRTLSGTPITRSDLTRSAGAFEMDPDVVREIVRVVVALHLLLMLYALWRRGRDPGRAAIVECGALVLVTTLLCGPLVHKAHLCWSVLAFALLAARAMEAPNTRERWLNGVPLLLAATLIGLTVPALFGDHFVREILGRNAMTIGLECLFLGCLRLALVRKSLAEHPPLGST